MTPFILLPAWHSKDHSSSVPESGKTFKRLLYISSSFVPSREANSVHVMKMSQALATQVEEVVLFVRRGPLAANPYEFYRVRQNFKISWINSFGPRALSNFFYGLRAAWSGLHSSLNFDLVYTRNLWSALVLSFFSTPFIYESHWKPKGKISTAVQAWVLSRPSCRLWVCISESLRQLSMKALPPRHSSKIVVAHDAADPWPELGPVANPRMKAIYVGSLSKGRGIDLLSEVARRLPDIDFEIAGGSAKEVSRSIEELSPPSNMYFLGHLSHPELSLLIGSADCFLAPYQPDVASIEWASPMKLFEYMAAGKAIVCSDFPVLHEVLAHEETALLVPAQSVEQWAGAVERLKDSPELRARLGQQAKSKFETHHDWTGRAERILNRIGVELRL